MAKRNRRGGRRRRNPTGLETGLLMGASVLVGGIGGFVLASWGCNRLFNKAIETRVLIPGENWAGPEDIIGT